ncbi:MAG: hypothetical protein L3K10_00210 [Thermoplasmata archaeon]|nr:hypothetical protein [Thermoplasmata archaeon]
MMVGLIGRLFVAAARLRPGSAGSDLAHVGEELRRLARPPAQLPTTSR